MEEGFYTCEELVHINEKLTDRVVVLEEQVKTIRAENNELRRFVNTVVVELNAVITTLNTRYNVNDA